MMKKYFAVLMIFVLVMGIGTGAMAAGNKKESILSEMDAAAAELGVQNSVTYQNAYTSVANYEGTITDEQYEAALAEIQAIKDAIASKGVDVVRQDETLMNELIAHVISAAEAVGIKVVYEGNGSGKVIFDNSTGNTGAGAEDGANGLEGTASKPIKQTGLDYTPTFILGAGILAAFGGCIVVARKKNLFV